MFATTSSLRALELHDWQFAHTPSAKQQFVKVMESSPKGTPLLNSIVKTAEIFKAFGGYEESVQAGEENQHAFHKLKFWDGVTPQVENERLHFLLLSWQ